MSSPRSIMAGKPHASRNPELACGITRYSRSAMYKRKALYKKKKVAVKSEKKPKHYYKLQPIKGEKNGNKRVVLLKKSVSFQLKHTHHVRSPIMNSPLPNSLATTQPRTIAASCARARSLASLVCEVPSLLVRW